METIIGWKKVVENTSRGPIDRLLKLKIVGNVVRPYGVNKRRTSEAVVLGVYNIAVGDLDLARYYLGRRSVGIRLKHQRKCFSKSPYYYFEYKTGATVKPSQPLDEDPEESCGSGIHYFESSKEAANYFDF